MRSLFTRATITTFCFSVLILSPNGAAGAEGEKERILVAQGEGTVEVAPDAVRVTITIATLEPTLAPARKKNEDTIRRVLGEIQRLAIPRLVMKTGFVQVSVVRDEEHRERNRLPRIIGYHVANQITIRSNDNDPAQLSQRASQIMEKSLAVGGNAINIDGVEFFRADAQSAYKQALRLATDDAKANAAILAGKAGVKLGRLKSLTPAWGSYYPRLSSRSRGYWGEERQQYVQATFPVGSDAGPTVAAGAFLVHANVNAAFEIQ